MSNQVGNVSEEAISGAVSSASILGEVTWLLSYSPLHRDWPIGSIQQWIMPALLHQQFKLFKRNNKPCGFVSWACMSKEVEEAYVLNTATLKPSDWVSGERNWIIDFIAPFGDTMEIAHDLKYNILANNFGRYLRTKSGSDTLEIRYLYGAKVREEAKDWSNNPTVELPSKSSSNSKSNSNPKS